MSSLDGVSPGTPHGDLAPVAPHVFRHQGRQAHLYHADWPDLVERLPDASIDLMYVDPPFNTGRTLTGKAGAYVDVWPGWREYIRWLGHCLERTLPKLKRTASVLLHVDFRVSHRVRVLLDEQLGEDRFVNHLIWSYGLGGSSPRRFARKHDDIFFYAVDPEAYWFEPPRVQATSNRLRGQTKKATDVLTIPSINNMAAERTGYPTQKPLELLRLLVAACCPPGGTVFDPCCGSGTTLDAALREGRHAIGGDRSDAAIRTTRNRLLAAGFTD